MTVVVGDLFVMFVDMIKKKLMRDIIDVDYVRLLAFLSDDVELSVFQMKILQPDPDNLSNPERQASHEDVGQLVLLIMF